MSLLAVLAWEHRVPLYATCIGALVAIGIVAGINHWAGNYGWIVLFRYSFIGGKYPAQVPHILSVREYISGLSAGIGTALTQLSLWILIGIWSWTRRPDRLLLVAAGAAIAHFLLFPSAEVRYLMWACIVAAVTLIRSFSHESVLFGD